MFALVAGRFAQADSRARAQKYLLGLLSGVERKNSWSLAELAGDSSPDGMQRLLNFYRWDAEAVRDDVRGYVLAHLDDPSGVFVGDETGFIKKGTKSAGVQRQYTGTSGKIDNCQVGVFLTYVSRHGRALIDRELYLPQKSWCADRDRCREAGIDDEVEFATKPQLACRMLARLLDAGVTVGWFTADELYGDNPALRNWLAEQAVNYVLAVSCDHLLTTPTGPVRADVLTGQAPARGWQRLSAGRGSKGHRLYDWLLIDPGPGERHHLLVRRSITDPTDLAYYVCHAGNPVPLAELVRVAGSRWAVEETFQFAKNETGLDHYQVRKYIAWYRHITLAMLAAAFLAVTAHTERIRTPPPPHPAPEKGAPEPILIG
ncbi:IS701 family transposase [Kibdelosporangium philippinense]|uniref:IS701 family transposase n=2 Tax=Kibdelosporangium philippinense TaxID=211113 RepID=A0ABS8ZAV5_9PSEU|nr:IS701 family transposase [Kibdelosporangium philippinense]MCE7004284.1 IS701 family transposase [Kibdelosporangium philippinense]